jgi:hypothetical protein
LAVVWSFFRFSPDSSSPPFTETPIIRITLASNKAENAAEIVSPSPNDELKFLRSSLNDAINDQRPGCITIKHITFTSRSVLEHP